MRSDERRNFRSDRGVERREERGKERGEERREAGGWAGEWGWGSMTDRHELLWGMSNEPTGAGNSTQRQLRVKDGKNI